MAYTTNGMAWDVTLLRNALLNTLLGMEVEIPDLTRLRIDPDSTMMCQGTYYNEELNMRIMVRAVNGTITAFPDGQVEFGLDPVSPTKYKFEQAYLELQFRDEEEGSYQTMMLFQAGSELEFARE